MQKTIILFLSLMVLATLISCQDSKISIPETEMYFFYLELCPGCDDYIMAEDISKTVINLIQKYKTVSGESLNIIHDEDAAKMRDILTEKNLKEISHVLPLLILNESYYVGYEEIREKLKEFTELSAEPPSK